jgi:glycosyltransferase involved in cell wall biosynthesis
VHLVPGSFGHRFSGITRRLYSLLSGWQERDIILDLWGTDLRPVNMNSGDMNYQLPQGRLLWADPRETGRLARAWAAVRLLATLVSRRKDFDIAHLHYSTWGALLSPAILHLIGRKAIYHMTLSGSDNPSTLAQLPGGRLALALLRRFDGIVTVSPRLAEDCAKQNLRNVLCLTNFLALRQLERGRDVAAREKVRRELSIPLDATVLLFVGSVIRRKGVDLLAECYARLAPRHHDLRLIIVGPQSPADDRGIDEEFIRSVRDRISRAGVTTRVLWAGMMRDNDELPRYYSAADIFVFPTRAEGLPNVLIEAIAAGLPCVATYLRGSTDFMVADGETGFLFPPEDVDAMTQAVERLVSDLTLRAKMGQAAHAHSKRFGFENYRRLLRAFYLRVAGRSLQ